MSLFPKNSAFQLKPPLAARTPPPTPIDREDARHVANHETLEHWYRELDELIHDTLAPSTHIASRISIEAIDRLVDLRDEILSHLR